VTLGGGGDLDVPGEDGPTPSPTATPAARISAQAGPFAVKFLWC
jgi:hypothetical protein